MVKRYKEVLAIFQAGKNMAKSFEKYGVDRLAIVKTAAIAELAIAAPEEYDQVEKRGTVADFAKRCEEIIKANQVISATINKMKDDRVLLQWVGGCTDRQTDRQTVSRLAGIDRHVCSCSCLFEALLCLN